MTDQRSGEFADEWNPEGLCQFEDAHGVCNNAAVAWWTDEHGERVAVCDEHRGGLL